MQVKFTPLAERHIDELHRIVTERSGYESRADGYVNRILQFCEGLSDFPHRGNARDDLLPGLRVVGFERRISIAFVVLDETVLIEGIYYGGRNFEADYDQGED